MGYVDIDLLFERRPDGSIMRRKPGVWASIADACRDCGTTEKPHEAFGYCRTCYIRFKRRTDPEWKARKNHIQKMQSIKHADRVEAYDKARANDPKRREQRRVISSRYYQKHAKWPLGLTVWDGVFRGTIVETRRGAARIQFLNGDRWVPFPRLSKSPPAFMEVA